MLAEVLTPDVVDILGEYLAEFLPAVAFVNRRMLSSFLTYKGVAVGVAR